MTRQPQPVVDDLIQDVVPLVTAGKHPEMIWLAKELYAAYVEQSGMHYLPVYDLNERRIVHVPVAPLEWR